MSSNFPVAGLISLLYGATFSLVGGAHLLRETRHNEFRSTSKVISCSAKVFGYLTGFFLPFANVVAFGLIEDEKTVICIGFGVQVAGITALFFKQIVQCCGCANLEQNYSAISET